MYIGDYELGETVNFRFTTAAPDTGAPTTLSGTPVISAYVGSSDTQITAGITLDVDSDAVTGMNRVTAVLTSGNGYADNTDIDFVITTGTVDGNSAVGYVVARCTLGRHSAYKRLGAPDGASVSADIAALPTAAEINAEVDTALADYDGPTKAELDTAVANVSVDEIQATALADLFNTDSGTTYASAVAGSVVKEIADNAGGSALTEEGIADAVWDELQSGHVGAGTFGEIATEIASILVDTAEIGAAGAGLTEAGGTGDHLTALATQASVDTIDGNVDAILVDTGTTLPASIDALPTAAENADAVWDESTTGHTTAGTFGEQAKTDIDAILADTNELQTDDIPGLIAALNDISAADVWSVSLTELSADPGTSPAASGAVLLPYMAIRNKRDTTATTDEIHNNAGTVILTASVSDDGTVFSKGKYS